MENIGLWPECNAIIAEVKNKASITRKSRLLILKQGPKRRSGLGSERKAKSLDENLDEEAARNAEEETLPFSSERELFSSNNRFAKSLSRDSITLVRLSVKEHIDSETEDCIAAPTDRSKTPSFRLERPLASSESLMLKNSGVACGVYLREIVNL